MGLVTHSLYKKDQPGLAGVDVTNPDACKDQEDRMNESSELAGDSKERGD